MNATVFLPTAPADTDDLSALAWVQDEVRRSLEAANKALHRHLKETESLASSDVDVVDPAVLRGARAQLHQAAGALELVGLPVPAQVLRASEAAVHRMTRRPALATAQAVSDLEHASFAVLDYLARLVTGKPVTGVELFPQYRAVQLLAGADRIHPADLWSRDWRWREIPAAGDVRPRPVDASAREAMERMMLRLMRAPDRATLRHMSDLCADLGAGSQGRLATLWRLGAGFFEAQSAGLLRGDVFVKRAVPRLLAQARAGAHPADVSERLAQDLLFFCARAEAPTADRPAPRLVVAREAYGVQPEESLPDYEAAHLGRFDPAWIAQARKRVSVARDAWSAVAGNDLHRIHALAETFALVGDSLNRLYPDGDLLAQALMGAAQQTVQHAAAPPPALAMEVATSVLYLEASLEDGDLDHPDLAARIARLAQRVDAVRQGAEPQPLDGWMEELYRRVSDRQTMGSVVQELRSSLSEVEKEIDQYFRNPAQREVLYPVSGQLSSMRGVLSVLGLDQASHAVLRMRDDVDALAQTEVDVQQASGAGTFDRLADSLGALSFLIDMLSVQPQLAKSLFSYDAESGRLKAVMGQGPRNPVVVDAAPDTAPGGLTGRAQQLALNAARDDVSDDTLAGQLDRLAQQAMIAEERTLAETMAKAKAALARTTDGDERRALRTGLAQAMQDLTAPPPLPTAAPSPAPGDDSEMREVFIEEAREVVQEARAAMTRLAEPGRDPQDDLSEMTSIRRAFHTFKGSARMVGLGDFGEAAWACEQLYNARLAQGATMDAPLRSLTGEALEYLSDWVESIAAGDDGAHRSAPVVAAADALRQDGRLLPIGAAAAPVVPLAEAVPDLPPAFELDLASFEPPAPAVEPAAPPADEPAGPADDFALDLGDLPMPQWEPEPADIGMAATLPLLPQIHEAAPQAPLPTIETIELDLGPIDEPMGALLAPEPEPMAVMPEFELEPASTPMAAATDEARDLDDQVKVIGPLRIEIAMFNIYLNEADELSRRLSTEIAEWATAASGVPGETAVVLAHSLAGSSATVGFADLSGLARALEHALMRSNEVNRFTPDAPPLYGEAADEIRRLLHQFAAGFLKAPTPGLVERLEMHEPAREAVPAPVESEFGALGAMVPAAAAMPHAVREHAAVDEHDDIDAVDVVEPELFPIFAEEAEDLVPQLQSRMRDWIGRPGDSGAAAACMRTLHTFKGGARLAGAMRLGEMAHRLETAIEQVLAHGDAHAATVEPLLGRVDAIESTFELLRSHVEGASVESAAAALVATETPAPMPLVDEARVEEALAPPAAQTPQADLAVDTVSPIHPLVDASTIDWTRFAGTVPARALAQDRAPAVADAAVRVRASLLDRLVGHSGEVSIARARIEADVGQIKGSLADLTENMERMRRQLRDIELQAESQINSRMEAAKAAAQDFDPLEMDRFTRFQELTRMMAESVNDVATVHRGLQRSLQSAEDELAAQARLTRSLQDDLLRTRMVEFDALADRLYRVVRQAAKETGKQVRLDIVGGSIEIDRGVLDRMTGPFEHLLRNAVSHGIEAPAARLAAGKDAAGVIEIQLHQEGNEVAVEVRDDGAGLDLARIRERAVEMGLRGAAAQSSDGDLADCIFMPGFSTANVVTEIAGRGVGMDVVRSEVVAMGGRIQTATKPGQGTSFKLLLPLTTAVTQVVLLRCGESQVAVPSTLVEVVRRVGADELGQAYQERGWAFGDTMVPFYWLGALLDGAPRGAVVGRTGAVVVIRSAAQRVAVHVDEVLGNQEVVVKNLGPQLARLPGLAGMTLLPSGAVAPIYNPVALATLYGAAAHERLRAVESAGDAAPVQAQPAAEALAPLVLVVDDSLTVRRVTQRLLVREGYRVTTAKDGLDAIERLEEETPAVILSDIEMPRMDGFDFVRNVRADARFAALPVIMITSRIAQKHRDYARELGVDHYLGKPYGEDELLGLVARFARREAVAAPS